MNNDKLLYEHKLAFDELNKSQKIEVEEMSKNYRTFLDAGKTEREVVKYAILEAEKNGFINIENKISLSKGDKVYIINRDKNIMLAIIGENMVDNGISIVGAHIDSPRIDLKQNPLYESGDMSLLKTHYYGGIKKYQWTAMPLSMHGFVILKNGEKVNICIGEDEDDPVFCITDLLPHLAKDQMKKTLAEAFTGEDLNILFGGYPIEDKEEKNRFKINALRLLNEKYGIVERDFLSAEIEMVPAFKAKNVGIDSAFVGAYGQDDRVCAYTALRSILDIKNPKKTAVCILVDKEEIGSCGNTGMISDFFRVSVARLIKLTIGKCDYLDISMCFASSSCMSSDVSVCLDPNYESVSEKQNSATAGGGMVLMKYTGARGKSSSSDANAEFVYKICKVLDDNEVVWQSGELGKVDQGGGGTIAQYVANMNIDVIDCGVPVLSMHAPFEVTAKCDIYMAYRSYVAYYNCF